MLSTQYPPNIGKLISTFKYPATYKHFHLLSQISKVLFFNLVEILNIDTSDTYSVASNSGNSESAVSDLEAIKELHMRTD